MPIRAFQNDYFSTLLSRFFIYIITYFRKLSHTHYVFQISGSMMTNAFQCRFIVNGKVIALLCPFIVYKSTSSSFSIIAAGIYWIYENRCALLPRAIFTVHRFFIFRRCCMFLLRHNNSHRE